MRTVFFVCLCMLPFCSVCSANPSMPMVFTAAYLVAVGWLVVTLIETAVFKMGLRRPYRETLQAVGAANLASTLAGYPLSWLMGLDDISGPSQRYFNVRVFGYGIFWRWILLTVSILTVAFLISVYLV